MKFEEKLFFETIEDMTFYLSRKELTEFLYDYDRYVATYYEDHDKSCEPVCMLEYFNNDYQEQ